MHCAAASRRDGGRRKVQHEPKPQSARAILTALAALPPPEKHDKQKPHQRQEIVGQRNVGFGDGRSLPGRGAIIVSQPLSDNVPTPVADPTVESIWMLAVLTAR